MLQVFHSYKTDINTPDLAHGVHQQPEGRGVVHQRVCVDAAQVVPGVHVVVGLAQIRPDIEAVLNAANSERECSTCYENNRGVNEAKKRILKM